MDVRINKVSDEYICPYCLKNIKLSKIMFKPPKDYAKRLSDKRLSNYWNSVFGRYKAIFTETPVYPRFRKRGLFTIMNNVGVSVPYVYVNENGITYETRVCPNCHNVLPPNAGFVNTANVLIIGNKRDHNYNYTKMLYKSLLAGVTSKNVSFYLPQVEVNNAIKNNENDLKIDDSPLLFGKASYSEKGKTLCEFTITHLPLSLQDLGHYNNVFLDNIFSNVDALIFAVDITEFKYFNTVSSGSEPVRDKSDSPLHKYLYRINELVGNIGHSDLDIPVSVVITGLEKIEQIQSQPDKAQYIKGKPSLNYEEEINNNGSKVLMQSIDNIFVQQFAKRYKNISFFVVNSLDKIDNSNISSLQNPLRWIIEEFDCKPEESKNN